MIIYNIEFKTGAIDDVKYFKRLGDKSVNRKIKALMEELAEHPEIGTGKPEQLKGDLSGCWSRRINREHRLIYTIEEDTVCILSLRGHYN